MFEQEATLFRFNLGNLQRIIADFRDDDLWQAMPGVVNPPGFVLGHLAISNDFGLRILGQPLVCPTEWMQAFGPGNSPDKMTLTLPTKAELMAAIERGHAEFLAALPGADPQAMRQQQAFPFFKDTPIQSMGDCVALLLTVHFAFHLGQLSLMRRHLGFPPLF